MPADLPVLFASDHEIVVVKPAGMACELTSDPAGVALISRVRARHGPGARLVHRLDRVTRGIVLVALDREAAALHSESLRAHRWSKFYLARTPSPDREVVGAHRRYLKTGGGLTRVVHAGGRPSFLEILEVAAAPGRAGESHLLVRLLTGRKHQVRVMLADLGVPLVGDLDYGGRPGTFYLEHAVLRFTDSTGAGRVAWWPDDPDREALDERLEERLRCLVSEDPAGEGAEGQGAG